MRTSSAFRIIGLAVTTALVLVGCGGTPPAPSVTSVTVTPATAILNIGQNQQLTANVVVQNGAATTVTWSSSNNTVASVNSAGLVTANAAGTATITATSTVDGSKKGTATITVNAAVINSVSISPSSALLSIGGTQQFTATVTGSTGFNNAVNWSTSNGTVASVSSTGLVTANAAGTATITATSVADPTKSASATVTVVDTLTFQNYSAVVATAGQAIPTQNASVAGGSTPYTFSAVDPLPAGLSLDPATGAISGTPTTASAAADYTIRVTDNLGATADATINITVNAALSVGTNYTSPVALTVGQAFTSSTPVVSGGTAPITYSAASLPAGLSVSSTTGVVSGTPSAASAAADYTITATDANGATVDLTLNITVNAAPNLTYSQTRALTSGIAVVTANFSKSVTGGTAPFSYSIAGGTLPTGLSLDGATGDISGSSTEVGTFPITIEVADVNGATSQATFNLVINSAPSFTTGYTNATLTVGAAYSSATPGVIGGTTPRTFSVSPTLPAGLSINSTTGVISGTPSSASSTTTYTVTLTDANGATTTTSLQITVNAALNITYSSTSYSASSNASNNTSVAPAPTVIGGVPPYSFTVFSQSYTGSANGNPSFNNQFNLAPANGAITTKNTPAVGTYTVVIRVTDANGAVANSATLTITVTAP